MINMPHFLELLHMRMILGILIPIYQIYKLYLCARILK